MLPTYTRLGPSTASVRRALRTREKFLILLVFATLTFVCFGGVFYLPDNFVPSDKVRQVYKQIQSAGPEIFIPAPPVARPHHHQQQPHDQHSNHIDNSIDAPNESEKRILHDRNRLHAKIQGDWAANAAEGDHLEKPQAKPQPQPQQQQQQPPIDSPLQQPPDMAPEKRQVDNNRPGDGAGVAEAPEIQFNLPNGEDSDPEARQRRNKIREVSIKISIFL